MKAILLFLVTLFFCGWIVLVAFPKVSSQVKKLTDKIEFETRDPDSIEPRTTNSHNLKIRKDRIVVSYNPSRNTADWVAWELAPSDIGMVDRGQFYPEPTLPSGVYRVTPFDYTNSGYDRGHLCPSGDRTATVEANLQTFTMINIVPQTAETNRGPWEALEKYCRKMVKRENSTAHIVAGVSGSQGEIKNHVIIPAAFWKIVKWGNGSSVAIWMPNAHDVSKNWQDYKVSPAQIEARTGMRF